MLLVGCVLQPGRPPHGRAAAAWLPPPVAVAKSSSPLAAAEPGWTLERADLGSSLARAEPSSPSAVVVLDDFETGPWPTPGLWYLPPSTLPLWWPSACQAAGGSRSLRAFGGPSVDGEVPCDYRPPAGEVSTVYLDLDLRAAAEASRLELYFQLWMKVPGVDGGDGGGGGLFLYLLVPENEGYQRVPIFGATGGDGQWVFPARYLDLMALADIENPTDVYDLRGGQWRLEWSALAPANLPAGGGIFIDDLTLLWEPDAAVPTPSPRPSLTPTATRTPTSTSTPTAAPTWTPSPTATATKRSIQFGTLLLPYVANELVSVVTPTAGPTATPSPTPEPEWRLYLPHALREAPPPASATPGEPVTPTGAPTVTASATAEPTLAATSEPKPAASATTGPTPTATSEPKPAATLPATATGAH